MTNEAFSLYIADGPPSVPDRPDEWDDNVSAAFVEEQVGNAIQGVLAGDVLFVVVRAES